MPMNRRDFLKRSALIATGAIAADQLELLERLGHVRKFFPSAAFPYQYHTYQLGYTITQELLEDDLYGAYSKKMLESGRLVKSHYLTDKDAWFMVEERKGPKRLLLQ